jgi:hypothetical protein
MSYLLDSALTAAQRQECEANDAALARAMAPTLGLRVNRGPATPVSGSAMDALMASLENAEALGVEVGRVEISETEAIQMDLAWQRDRAARDARRLSETVQVEAQLDEMRRGGAL